MNRQMLATSRRISSLDELHHVQEEAASDALRPDHTSHTVRRIRPTHNT